VSVAVRIGSGVTRIVRRHGGRLYVWTIPHGSMQRTRTGFEPPEGIKFIHLPGVREFQLFVSEPVHAWTFIALRRRSWWPNDAIVADTGFWMTTGN
jgi:hypothetical protein